MRAAILGLGQVAWRYDGGRPGADGAALTHLSACRAAGDIAVIGGADAHPGARQAWTEGTGLPVFDTAEALLALKPDLVSIASPNALHGAHLEACLDAGIPMVWLEKPATEDPGQTRRLAARAAREGCRVLVGFQRRYLPVYRSLRRAMAGAPYGAPLGIEVVYSRGLATNGAHLVDLVLQLLGDVPPRLRGVTARSAPVHVPEPSPSFLLQTEAGLPVTVTGLDADHHSIDLTVHFGAGRLSVLYGGLAMRAERRIPNPMFPGFFRLAPDPGYPVESPGALAASMGQVFPAMLADLRAAHAGGGAPLSTLHSAAAGQSIVAAVLGEGG